MISSTRTLPDGYRQTGEINLAKNKGLSILMNLAAAILFVPCLVLVGSFLSWRRPDLVNRSLGVGTLGIIVLFASVIFLLLLHELIHGFSFWIFTRSKPVFALRPLYAYAAAPDWFIPARQYWIVGLAPLLLIGVTGLLLISVAPAGWSQASVFWVALNTAGSVGDLFIVARLLRLAPGSLVKDTGDSVSFFEPMAAASESA